MDLIKRLLEAFRLFKEHAVMIITVILVIIIVVIMPPASIGYLLYVIAHIEHIIEPLSIAPVLQIPVTPPTEPK